MGAVTGSQSTLRSERSRSINAAGYRGGVSVETRSDRVDEHSETQRINDLEAWAFRAGRDLAEIKGELKLKSTVAAVDALHQDMRELQTALDDGFAAVNERLDGQQRLLEEILDRLPAAG